MSFPKIGMYFEDVRKKLKTFKSVKNNPNMKNSLLNQARLKDGEGAVKELNEELSKTTSFSGSGNKQICGIDICRVCHKVSDYCICQNKKGSE